MKALLTTLIFIFSISAFSEGKTECSNNATDPEEFVSVTVENDVIEMQRYETHVSVPMSMVSSSNGNTLAVLEKSVLISVQGDEQNVQVDALLAWNYSVTPNELNFTLVLDGRTEVAGLVLTCE